MPKAGGKPLRGPDEIAHFLRIYSYAGGELLPAVEVDGRKGILIERELHALFKNTGERFAQDREHGLRYGEILQEQPGPDGPSDDEEEQGWKFMSFAGTEGYNPVAYAPYVVAAGIGNLLGLASRRSHLEQCPLSAISVFAERAVAALVPR